MRPLPNRSRVTDSTVAIAGVLGCIVLFLPFTYDVSPWEAVRDRDVWALGAPFFLSIPLVPAAVCWLVAARVPRPLMVGAFILSSLTTVVVLWNLWPVVRYPEDDDWLAIPLLAAALAILVIGGLATRRTAGRAPDYLPIVALEVPYLANLVFCAIGFSGRLQSGAYLGLCAAVPLVADLVRSLDRGTPASRAVPVIDDGGAGVELRDRPDPD